MWISKKMWNEMCNRVARTERELRYLENCHNGVKTISFRGERFETNFVVGYEHPIEKVDTDKVKDVTFEEIAKLVIDGKRIARKTTEEKINYYGGSGIE